MCSSLKVIVFHRFQNKEFQTEEVGDVVDRSQSVFYFVPQESHSQAGLTIGTWILLRRFNNGTRWQSV